jgi:hypothetical protein
MDWGFVAEDADAYQVLASSVEREVRVGAVLIHGPTGDTWSNLATRVRFGQDDAAAGVQEVRAWFAVRSVEEYRWLVGPSATPPDLISALVSLGASPDEAEPELTAMVLDHAPPLVPNVAVREVGSQSDFEQMERIRRVVFADASTPSPEELRTGWAALSGSEGSKAFLAESMAKRFRMALCDVPTAAPGFSRVESRCRGHEVEVPIGRLCGCVGRRLSRWERRRW